MNAIIPRATIDQIVGWRDRAIELYEVAFNKIEEADQAVRAARAAVRNATPGNDSFTYSQADEVRAFETAVELPSRDQYLRVARRLTDCTVWAYIIERTDLERLMDKEAKDHLRDQMRYVPERTGRDGQVINQDEIDRGLPPVTVENVHATLEAFASEADFIWRRGLANSFAKLDRRFRSHDGWKVGSRIILDRVFDEHGWWSRRNMQDVIMDIERAFTILDGREPQANYASTVGRLETERRGQSGARQSEHETDYFRIRIFKNGNIHLWMKRDDLVVRVNQILGEYYGDAIGDQENVPTDEDVLNNPKTAVAKNFGFFPTPALVAEQVIAEARIYGRENTAPLSILEPSAGTGNLSSRAAAPRTLKSKRDWNEELMEWEETVLLSQTPIVDVVELHADRVAGLHLQGLYRRVVHSDFLHLREDPSALYDRVVMNPPFDRERDIDHVVHALKFLAKDGILVSVMSAGTEFRETKKSVAFRNLVEERGGYFIDLPERSFAECGTNVNTILCVIGRKRW